MCEPATKAVITCLRMQPRIHSLCEINPDITAIPCLDDLDTAVNCVGAYQEAKGRAP